MNAGSHEVYALAGVFYDRTVIHEIAGLCAVDDFRDPRHRLILRAMHLLIDGFHLKDKYFENEVEILIHLFYFYHNPNKNRTDPQSFLTFQLLNRMFSASLLLG